MCIGINCVKKWQAAAVAITAPVSFDCQSTRLIASFFFTMEFSIFVYFIIFTAFVRSKSTNRQLNGHKVQWRCAMKNEYDEAYTHWHLLTVAIILCLCVCARWALHACAGCYLGSTRCACAVIWVKWHYFAVMSSKVHYFFTKFII